MFSRQFNEKCAVATGLIYMGVYFGTGYAGPFNNPVTQLPNIVFSALGASTGSVVPAQTTLNMITNREISVANKAHPNPAGDNRPVPKVSESTIKLTQ